MKITIEKCFYTSEAKRKLSSYKEKMHIRYIAEQLERITDIEAQLHRAQRELESIRSRDVDSYYKLPTRGVDWMDKV